MMRSLRIFTALALLAGTATAQSPEIRRLGGHGELFAYLETDQMLTATPKWWRDSVFAAWVHAVPSISEPLNAQLQPGARLTLVIRLRRSGDLFRARLAGSTGVREVDQLLIAAADSADQALKFPALPANVEGAGAEIRINIAVPVPQVVTAGASQTNTASRFAGVDLPPPSPACRDSLARPNSFRAVAIGLRVDSVTGQGPMMPWVEGVARALAARWGPPLSVVPARPPSVFYDQLLASYLLDGTLRLRLDASGRLLEVSLPVATGSPALDSALIATAEETEAAHAFPAPPPGRGDTVTIDLALDESRGGPEGPTRLGEIRLGSWEPETRPMPRKIGPLRYPEVLRADRVGGRVVVEFIVGADGAPVPATVTVVSTPHLGFTNPAQAMIRESEYTPARLRGCAVPMVVRQAINFQP